MRVLTSGSRVRERVFGERARRRLVGIDRCYHYRGFRYGGFGHNPYEDYVLGLQRGDRVSELRASFADRILNCRPRSMGEALQLDLESWAAWDFPWQPESATPPAVVEPQDNPDIVCHFCAAGVLASHVNREFGWLEGAFRSIREEGYQPKRFGFITCIELRHDGRSSFLVLDGNHRLAALHATGVTAVVVRVLKAGRVRREDAVRWPAVVENRHDLSKSLMVFDRYFSEANPPLQRMNPARVICDEAPAW